VRLTAQFSERDFFLSYLNARDIVLNSTFAQSRFWWLPDICSEVNYIILPFPWRLGRVTRRSDLSFQAGLAHAMIAAYELVHLGCG
jgi:hypothetical protein